MFTHKKYNRLNTRGEMAGNFADKTSKYHLNVMERLAIYQSVHGTFGSYNRERQRFSNRDFDNVAKTMIGKAMEVQAMIDKNVNKEMHSNNRQFRESLKPLRDGQAWTCNLDYKTSKGKEVKCEVGMVKGSRKHKYFTVDQDTGKRNYISKQEFNNIRKKAFRQQVKEGAGIKDDLYTLRANDGHTFSVTDSRDDKVKNSFKDGFRSLNVFERTPNGMRTQMDKATFRSFVKLNGVDMDSAKKGKISTFLHHATDKALHATKSVLKFAGHQVGNAGRSVGKTVSRTATDAVKRMAGDVMSEINSPSGR